MRILERGNYYNVILASKATATADEVYKTGTTFDEVYALYNFDRELRNIYLKYLLKLENTFKTVIAHDFVTISSITKSYLGCINIMRKRRHT